MTGRPFWIQPTHLSDPIISLIHPGLFLTRDETKGIKSQSLVILNTKKTMELHFEKGTPLRGWVETLKHFDSEGWRIFVSFFPHLFFFPRLPFFPPPFFRPFPHFFGSPSPLFCRTQNVISRNPGTCPGGRRGVPNCFPFSEFFSPQVFCSSSFFPPLFAALVGARLNFSVYSSNSLFSV